MLEEKKFGLSKEIIEKLKVVFNKNLFIDKVIIYGSRAKGSFKNGSDIDLTLIGQNLSTTDLFKIENDLDDLLLPYKIDLSVFHHIDNVDLVDHINRVGIEFFKR